MKGKIGIITSVFCVILLAGCSSASFFIANLPGFFSKSNSYKNIAYGTSKWQKLDIYLPQNVQKQSPVLIFFYGGRWTFGNKEQYAFTALPFVEKGYIVVLPDYSKYPDVKFPTFVKDAANAVAWVHGHIEEYKGDPGRIYLSGHSSGAHIAALTATDPRYLDELGKDRKIIKAFAGLAGPYAFVPEEKDLKDMFGPPENYPNMQVTSFIDGRQPPMLLLHGEDDQDVVIKNLTSVEAKIREKGGIVETKIYPSIDHKEIMGSLSWVLNGKTTVRDDMLKFFERHK